MLKVKTGKFYKVKNKDKQKAANSYYNMIVVENSSGDTDELFFTDSDLIKAQYRIKKNREDVPPYEVELYVDNYFYWIAMVVVSVVSGALGYFLKTLG